MSLRLVDRLRADNEQIIRLSSKAFIVEWEVEEKS